MLIIINQLRITFYAWLILFLIHRPLYAETIQMLLNQAQSGRVFQTPSQREVVQAQYLFQEMFKGKRKEGLQPAWAELNFNLYQIKENNRDYLVVVEKKNHQRGRGFFLFPMSPLKKKIVLQFPHSFKDYHTGKIGLKLVLDGGYAGAAWNTVPREFKIGGHLVDADFSDLFNTYFAAFARAFAGLYPDGYLIQLHGYAKHKRKTEMGKESDIIISSGTRAPGDHLISLDKCLERSFETVVSVYPLEVMELGATKTSIGIILRRIGHFGFIHIEMSKTIRSGLKDKEIYRKKLSSCFQEILK